MGMYDNELTKDGVPFIGEYFEVRPDSKPNTYYIYDNQDQVTVHRYVPLGQANLYAKMSEVICQWDKQLANFSL